MSIVSKIRLARKSGMVKILSGLTGCAGIVLLTAATGWCHGVQGDVDQGRGYLVTARYDNGEPMNYAAVEIKAPDSETVFQTGRTDRNGHFMLDPDLAGQWQIVLKDGMGHRLALDLTVIADEHAHKTPGAEDRKILKGTIRIEKIISGLSMIIGLFGFLYGWKSRRRLQAVSK